jgi:hypothetical protein
VTYNYRRFKRSCKFWIEPEIVIDENKSGDFTDKELNEIETLIYENKEILINQLILF